MTAPTGSSNAMARHHERLILTALTTTMVLLVLDSSIVGVMLPSMTHDLRLSTADGAWIVSSYLLTLAVFLPLGGRLSDALGPVRMFQIGMTGFIVASAAIATIPDFLGVLGGRAVAGVAAAMLMPATLALLMQAIDVERRPAAMATYTGVGQAFGVVGPIVGGVCAQFLSWQWGFLLNVPVGIAGLVLIGVTRPANTRTPVRRWDVVGLLLLVTGVGLTMTALLEAPDRGWQSPFVLGALIAGLAALPTYVRHARRVTDPILNLGLLARRDFAAQTFALFGLGFALTVATVYGASALQDALRLSPAMAGLAVLPLVVPLLITTRTVAARYDELGLRRVALVAAGALSFGLVIVALGFAIDSLVVVTLAMIPAGAGIGALLSPLTAATVGSAPADLRGQASGLITMCRQVGGVVGIAVFSACVAAIPGGTGTALGFLVAAAVMAAAAVTIRTLPR